MKYIMKAALVIFVMILEILTAVGIILGFALSFLFGTEFLGIWIGSVFILALAMWIRDRYLDPLDKTN